MNFVDPLTIIFESVNLNYILLYIRYLFFATINIVQDI